MFGGKHAPVAMTFAESIPLPLRDNPSDDVSYIGYSQYLGVGTEEAKWLIIRITRTETSETPEYANGSSEFKSVWDDREDLDYSR